MSKYDSQIIGQIIYYEFINNIEIWLLNVTCHHIIDLNNEHMS